VAQNQRLSITEMYDLICRVAKQHLVVSLLTFSRQAHSTPHPPQNSHSTPLPLSSYPHQSNKKSTSPSLISPISITTTVSSL